VTKSFKYIEILSANFSAVDLIEELQEKEAIKDVSEM
jgi:hypothetical protein